MKKRKKKKVRITGNAVIRVRILLNWKREKKRRISFSNQIKAICERKRGRERFLNLKNVLPPHLVNLKSQSGRVASAQFVF